MAGRGRSLLSTRSFAATCGPRAGMWRVLGRFLDPVYVCYRMEGSCNKCTSAKPTQRP